MEGCLEERVVLAMQGTSASAVTPFHTPPSSHLLPAPSSAPPCPPASATPSEPSLGQGPLTL